MPAILWLWPHTLVISLNVAYISMNVFGHSCFKLGKGFFESLLSLMFLYELRYRATRKTSFERLTPKAYQKYTWRHCSRNPQVRLQSSCRNVWNADPKVYGLKKSYMICNYWFSDLVPKFNGTRNCTASPCLLISNSSDSNNDGKEPKYIFSTHEGHHIACSILWPQLPYDPSEFFTQKA